jgi:hypothetical protein
MFTALGFIQVITGFIVQDRLRLDAETTGLVTGGALLIAGLGLIVTQAVIVPRSGWPTPTLRVGVVVASAGFALLLIGLGLGTAMPGFTAGPTLLVDPRPPVLTCRASTSMAELSVSHAQFAICG